MYFTVPILVGLSSYCKKSLGAKGDAEKFNEIYRKYRKAPNLTKRRIYLETMEKLFNRFEDVTIVDPNVKGLLPVFGGQRPSPTGETLNFTISSAVWRPTTSPSRGKPVFSSLVIVNSSNTSEVSEKALFRPCMSFHGTIFPPLPPGKSENR